MRITGSLLILLGLLAIACDKEKEAEPKRSIAVEKCYASSGFCWCSDKQQDNWDKCPGGDPWAAQQ